MQLFKIFAPTLIASRSDDGRLRIEGVASSTVRDHHGDQMTVRALEKMAQTARGLTIFLNHEYRVPEDVFGSVERVKLTRAAQTDPKTKEEIWDLRFGIEVQRNNARAIQAFEQLEGGAKLGLSIGAMVPDGGAKFDKAGGGRYIVDDVELVETSLVGIPANPRSWIDYAIKSIAGRYPDKLTKEIRENTLREVLEAEGAKVVSLVDGEEHTAPATGIELEGIEVPADGSMTELVVEGEAGELVVEAEVAPEAPEAPEAIAASLTSDNVWENGTVALPSEITTTATIDNSTNVEKTRVTVWDGDKTVEIDTGRSKPKSDGDPSAQASDGSESAGGPTATGEAKKGGADAIALQGAVETTLQSSRHVIASLRASLTQIQAENDVLREERNAALEAVSKSVAGTAAVIAKLGDLPVGRKTGFVEIQKDFENLRTDLYGNDFVKLLQKGN